MVDTQLYLAFKPGDHPNETAAVSSILSCIRDVQNWMLMDRLKLNPDNTEFLILGTRQQLEKVITSRPGGGYLDVQSTKLTLNLDPLLFLNTFSLTLTILILTCS